MCYWWFSRIYTLPFNPHIRVIKVFLLQFTLWNDMNGFFKIS